MIEKLKAIDEKLFIWLNSFHADWLDPIVFQMTETVTWIPFYGILIYFIYRADHKGIWWVLGGAALTILISDQVTSGLMKPFFERLRPCHEERLDGVIHNYGRCGGLFGFVSSHAANTFAIATFLNLKIRDNLPYLKWIFLWAFIISYTRIYLGVHYPFDILLGAVIGVAAGWVSWFLIVIVRREILKKFLK
ncbi:MAG: undecaprenyl-diphosphatase [Planctomycetota bacterium]|jgi:undecaprenyl-diphosphatase